MLYQNNQKKNKSEELFWYIVINNFSTAKEIITGDIFVVFDDGNILGISLEKRICIISRTANAKPYVRPIFNITLWKMLPRLGKCSKNIL